MPRLLLGLLASALYLSCAHEPAGPPALATIDIVDVEGHTGTLAYALGSVVVLDICAASVDVCLINARAMSEVCESQCKDGEVELVTLLVDETGVEAARSYLEIFEVKHRVYLPGPNARSGGSAIGSVMDVPRVLIFDREGRVVDDQVGAMLTPIPLVERILELK
ncbi:MAG: hypothetical protein D6701_04520 [Gemmatimonadetes bacterium]|nr:MAG: hypothetical protein D6701_04520 [Gemmatimonadota bacterium]